MKTLSFWQYCEEVAKAVGVNDVVNNIKIIHDCWTKRQPTDDAIIAVNQTVIDNR